MWPGTREHSLTGVYYPASQRHRGWDLHKEHSSLIPMPVIPSPALSPLGRLVTLPVEERREYASPEFLRKLHPGPSDQKTSRQQK